MRIVSLTFLLAASVAAGFLLTDVALSTGPGCPIDPSYLGYCGDLQ